MEECEFPDSREDLAFLMKDYEEVAAATIVGGSEGEDGDDVQ
jgi:hypothetical protein